MHRLKFHTAIIFFLALLLVGAKSPDITPKDVQATLQDIMKAHVHHKTLSSLLIQRAFEEFIEDLDPSKTYFTKDEVTEWISPTEEKLKKVLSEVSKGNFSEFDTIYRRYGKAIERRRALEALVAGQESIETTPEAFKEAGWASEKDLFSRLRQLQFLQISAAEKLEKDNPSDLLHRISKRREQKEEELLKANPEERQKAVLASVLKAFSSSLDSHTEYFTPAEASQFMVQLQQRLFGIGVQLRDDFNGFTILKILKEGPSVHSGLKENDRIIAVNGEPLVGLDIMDAVELIRGEENTRANLTVVRKTDQEEEVLEFEVVRKEIVIEEARHEAALFPYGDGVIVQLSLHTFYQDPTHSSAEDLRQEIATIRKEHKIKGIVLDLRHNSGGVLPQAVEVAGLFITKGIVVSIKDNNGKVEHLRNMDGRTAWDGPLLILTSKASASAAEIVAQTLQDYGRALVVGDPHTYGKGTFQTFTLDAFGTGKVNPKGEFKVTRGRYYTVSGKSPQLCGVKADIIVPGPFSELEIGEKLTKYPLENDSIPPNFTDDFSDIPPENREHFHWLYRFSGQAPSKSYTKWTGQLQKNSKERQEKDHFYQQFLTLVKEKGEISKENQELFGKVDFQLNESIEIMKDLIVLLK